MRWNRYVAPLVFAVGLGLATGAGAQCVIPLAGHGPADPAHGFPKYYIDSNGLALAACLDFLCDPALPVPDPLSPISFPTNFPVEFFYMRAIADAPAPLTGSIVLALEGSFFNGNVPLAGDQMVFSRVRVRLTGLTPNASYTIDHPYGSMVLTANAVGVINDTQDVGNIAVGLLPTAFDLALNGGVGPFLTFLSGPVPPLPGQIGTTLADQTVQGSPCGQNFLRIRGPGLPGAGLTQTLFNTLIGEKAAVCGNGVVDAGEQCDDGNTLAGDCCSATCQFEAAGSPCTAAIPNPCLSGSTCNGAGACAGGTPITAPCSDGNACTTGDACAGGVCVGGPAPNCDDLNVCTTDTCDAASGCVHTPNSLPCDDGSACTTGDACAGGVCVGGLAPNCNDGNPCTTDGCLPASGCFHTPSTIACNDGDACTIGDVCAGGACVPGGGTPNCDDGNPCTTDSCSPASGCVHAPNTLPCNDGNACTANDTCANGVCVGGAQPNCNDNNPCTTDSCNPTTGACLNAPNTLPCNDGNACTTGDVCANGVCTGTAVPCTPTAVTAAVTADVTVDSSVPSTNLGTKTQINADAGPTVKRAFLRVQVSGIGGQSVTAAHLGLKVASTTNAQSVTGGQLHRISNCSWGETTTTFNNQPAIDGPVLATLGAVSLGQTVDFDVTSVITADGTYCFAIDSVSTDGVDYLSREASSGKPTVTVTASCACGGGPACTPTTCAAQGKNCGSISDGCGGVLGCGSCTSPETCGGSGIANVCGAVTAAQPTAAVIADATVDSSVPTSKLGTKSQINVDAGPTVKRTFLRIQVGNVGARTVTGASLNLRAATTKNAQSVSGGQIHRVADCSWAENAITYNTQPAIDPGVISSVGAVALGQAVSFDLTSAIPGDGTYCFAIDSLSTDGVDYNSREASTVANRPTVTLTVGP